MWDTEAGRPQIQNHPQLLQSKFEASLEYLRPYTKTKQSIW